MINPKPDLKACPFCGQEAYFREFSNSHKGNCAFCASYEIGCSKCGISIKRESRLVLENGYPKFIKNGFEEAMGIWNSRVDSDTTDTTQTNTQNGNGEVDDDF